MRTFVLLLACFAHADHARRVQAMAQHGQGSLYYYGQDSRDFVKLLLSSKPEAAFNIAAPGSRSIGNPTRAAIAMQMGMGVGDRFTADGTEYICTKVNQDGTVVGTRAMGGRDDRTSFSAESIRGSSLPQGSAPAVSTPAFAPAASSSSSQASIATGAQPSPELLDLISRQVSVELGASQAYMSASIWFRAREMDGSAAWTLEESDEERGHGKQILEFAMKNHYPVTLEPLAAPKNDWNHPSEVWETILGLEQQNTQNLLRIADVADQCGMYGVKAFLDPFHVEQIDAEDKVGGILAKVKAADEALLWQIDHMLGAEAEEEDHH